MYAIKEGYIERLVPDFDNEAGKRDECQDEVYARAREYVDLNGFESVLDLGTGGGFKLLKYFSDKRTLGIDLTPTVAWLRSEYPERHWETDEVFPPQGFDVLISADVIEHLPNPDRLLTYIERCKPKLIVLSTPNRDNLQEHSWNGPPRNLCHVREWSSAEFAEYIRQRFEIIEHVFPEASRRDYSTMWIVARLK